MTTEEYRDELGALRDSISNFRACACYSERVRESERLHRAWKRLAYTTQPKRLPERERGICDRLLSQAAELLNNHLIDTQSGASDADPRPDPPAKAMADTMRFCNAMKRHGI